MSVCIYSKPTGKSWYARMEYKGNKKDKSTGIPVQGNNKRAADKKAHCMFEEFKKEIENEQKNKELFSEYLKQWLETYKIKIRDSTYQGYRNQIYKSMCPYFDSINLMLTDVKPYHIQDYYNHLIGKGLSPNTIQKHNITLNNALKYATRNEYITRNPMEYGEITRPKVVEPEIKSFTQKQIQKILQAVKGDEIELAVWLGYFCGLRREEILGLKWQYVDMNNKIIYIKETRTQMNEEIISPEPKSQKSKRYVPIPDKLYDFLKEYRCIQEYNKQRWGNSYIDTDYVYTYEDGKPVPVSFVSHKFKSIINGLGFDNDLHFHCLRHTYGTVLSKTESLKVVQEMMGHATITTTQRYIHPDMDSKRTAVMHL